MSNCADTLQFLISILIVTILICGATSACSQDPTPTPGTSSAAESDHVPAPPDDCWSGALSADPLHCYVIDQAHRDGVIEVEGVYDDESGSLYIYFNYLRPVEDWLYAELREFLVEKILVIQLTRTQAEGIQGQENQGLRSHRRWV